jgi:hypothetical protein
MPIGIEKVVKEIFENSGLSELMQQLVRMASLTAS